MASVIGACCLLVVLTTFLHYEVLGLLNARLPTLPVPQRAKLLVVMLAAFFTHAVEMGLYGMAYHLLTTLVADAGSMTGSGAGTLSSAMYFSAETYTSLGFGDVTPSGPIRLLAGVEALNGLLLIGWTASFTYLAMEHFWNGGQRGTDR